MDEQSKTPLCSERQAALDLPRQVERMHRRYLDVVRLQLDRHGFRDINPVQAVMLETIGGAQGYEALSVRDLIERGYYLGSNASYNLKNLVDGGYVNRQLLERDRRSALLSLSDKGRLVLGLLTRINETVSAEILKDDGAALETTFRILRAFEHRWGEAVRDGEDFSP
ncbi:MAG: MarR family transcriptional regulator [Alphaproteobacteria bacterium]|nr:MarR family transcriptional regulator [Alphaproteobacteria bacterium]